AAALGRRRAAASARRFEAAFVILGTREAQSAMPESPKIVSPKLLAKLASGADQELFTVGSWADRLRTAPGSEAFTAQMGREWYQVKVPDPFCQEMMDYARAYLAGSPWWPHIWAHILRVTGWALALAPEAGIEADRAFLLGIFHDLGKLDEFKSGEPHEERGATLARQQLKNHFAADVVEHLACVIEKSADDADLCARLLHDADKLDKIGATGIARRLSTNFGMRNVPAALKRVQQEAERCPAMSFPTSRRLRKLKLDFTDEFLKKVDLSAV